MKPMLLAAAAAVFAVASPAFAQDVPVEDTMTEQDQPAPTTTPAPAPMTTPAPAPMQTTPAPAPMTTPAPAPMAAPAPAAPMSTTMAPAEPTAGGYQPSTPALSGTPQPGARVIFRAAPSPDVAYPAPQPLESYPVCRAGQTDKCRNPGGV